MYEVHSCCYALLITCWDDDDENGFLVCSISLSFSKMLRLISTASWACASMLSSFSLAHYFHYFFHPKSTALLSPSYFLLLALSCAYTHLQRSIYHDLVPERKNTPFLLSLLSAGFLSLLLFFPCNNLSQPGLVLDH